MSVSEKIHKAIVEYNYIHGVNPKSIVLSPLVRLELSEEMGSKLLNGDIGAKVYKERMLFRGIPVAIEAEILTVNIDTDLT